MDFIISASGYFNDCLHSLLILFNGITINYDPQQLHRHPKYKN